MKSKTIEALESNDKYDLTSMIDVVFLLLIYFMFLPIKQEADLRMSLPIPAETPPEEIDPEKLPSEHLVRIEPNGYVYINNQLVDRKMSGSMPELTSILARLKFSSDRLGVNTIVLIDADDESPHQRTIDVLDSCAVAGIEMVTFSVE